MFKKIISALTVLTMSSPSFGKDALPGKITLTPSNTVVLDGEVNGNSVAQVMHDLYVSPAETQYLFINSPGGSIIDGLKLVNFLHSTDKNIVCVANFAASMAFVILQSCKTRLVTEDAVIMQHVASYSVQGQEPNNYSLVNFVRSIIKKMDKMQAERLGMTVEQFKSRTRDDWWLFDGDAVTEKAADGVVYPTCSPELAKQTKTITVRQFIFTAKLVVSGCPLIQGPLDVKSESGQEGRPEYQDFLKSLRWKDEILKNLTHQRK